MEQPQFALINGSNQDVLITGIHCCFISRSDNSSLYPEQKFVSTNSNELQMLLKKGEAIHCHIILPKKYEAGFHLNGETTKELNGAYAMQMQIDIQWADHKGKSHRARVPFQNSGFGKNNSLVVSTDAEIWNTRNSVNLYDKSVREDSTRSRA